MKEYNYTIIIPHKNIPKLLQRCLDSIPERSDIQIIIVDDNSDPTIVDFENFPGKRRMNTEIYLTKEGKGAGYARNIGLQHAKGIWLLFADADDYYAPNAFDIIDVNLNKELEILYFNIYSDSKHENPRAQTYNKLYNKYKETNNPFYIKYGCWTPWNKVLSQKFIFEHNLSFDEIPVGNDAMFALHASKYVQSYKIIFDKIYCLTDNNGSITFTSMSFERRFNFLKINIRIDKFLVENNSIFFCHNLFSHKIVYNLIKNYGIKKTIIYLRYLFKNMNIYTIFKIWVLSVYYSKRK